MENGVERLLRLDRRLANHHVTPAMEAKALASVGIL